MLFLSHFHIKALMSPGYLDKMVAEWPDMSRRTLLDLLDSLSVCMLYWDDENFQPQSVKKSLCLWAVNEFLAC